MADLKRLYKDRSADEVLLLLARAATALKENPKLKSLDLQQELKIGYEDSVVIFDWLVDWHAAEPRVSNHAIRCGRTYVLNTPFPTLADMAQVLGVGERRAFLIMRALEERSIIRIKSDFSFERIKRMSSFADLVRQVKRVSKKYRGRCEPPLLIRLLYLDPYTALRLAQYGEENLGLRWMGRQREML